MGTRFWIVTPSYNSLVWLKRCLPSVRDQASQGIQVHHHVQDAASTDGTPAYLKNYAERVAADASAKGRYSFSYASAKDNGMYDAINQGWDKAGDDVDVLAHLNCDEQYAPEALAKMATYFERHAHVDIAFADMIVIDKNGEYVCHRRTLKPHGWESLFCCVGFTATTFQRASVFQKRNVRFDTRWRNFGDKVWYNALHKAGCRFGVLHDITSLFTVTGANLNFTQEGLDERQRYQKEFVHNMGFAVFVIAKWLALRRWVSDRCLPPPKTYSLFWNDEEQRTVRPIPCPTGLWRRSFPKIPNDAP
ncbi:MAG: glycosyltransferase [Kiritimatiellaeota bacterium]|nr:glycosyltransferase [Kiritimatiellota bacterium]